MRSSKQLVSVVIPAYNRVAYIGEAIDSVLDQKLPKGYELELIVVDNGSTDKTAEVVQSYGDRLTFIQIPASGRPSIPRNVGIAAARGRLIAFQDSDDIWAPSKLVAQLPLFDDPEVIMAYGNSEIMTASGTFTGELVVPAKELVDGERFETLLQHNVISTLTVMVRRAALEKVGVFDESDQSFAIEDYQLWLRIVAAFPSGVKHISKTLAYYRTHDQNISAGDELSAVSRIIAAYNTVWGIKLSGKQRLALEKQLYNMQANWSRVAQAKDNASQPLISVVMSVYNGAEHLRLSIESILGQTYRNFEFIIIDDGSSDESAAIINSYDDDRIRLIHQTNHGLVYALNQGIGLSRGRFIARQDSDDIALPSRFEKELGWISKDPRRGLVSSFFTYIDEKTGEPSITLIFPTKHSDLVRNLYYTNPFAHSAALVRKQAIIEAGGYSDAYGPNEDYDLWRKIAANWETGIIPEVLLWYRINSASISHTKQLEQHKYAAVLIEELWATPPAIKTRKQIISDARHYKTFDHHYAKSVHAQYVAQQERLAYDLLRRGWVKAGYPTAFAALQLHPASIRRLAKPMISAASRKIRRRKRR